MYLVCIFSNDSIYHVSLLLKLWPVFQSGRVYCVLHAQLCTFIRSFFTLYYRLVPSPKRQAKLQESEKFAESSQLHRNSLGIVNVIYCTYLLQGLSVWAEYSLRVAAVVLILYSNTWSYESDYIKNKIINDSLIIVINVMIVINTIEHR